MCGIAGIHRLNDRPLARLDRLVSELLAGIEPRGTDATGYVAINDNGDVQTQKASCSAFYFNQHRARIMEDARTVLLHTRYATQGKPAFPENNHPVERGGVYAVHNGHIRNDSEIFKVHGKTRRGQVDSESIPALVVARGWDKVPACLSELRGDLAVALLTTRHPRSLVLARGDWSPLVYVKTDNLLVWASTSEAILDAWETVLGTPPRRSRLHYMGEGTALMVDEGKLRTVRFRPVSENRKPKWSTWKRWETWKPSVAKAPVVDDPEGAFLGITDEELAALTEEANDWTACDDCGDWFPLGDLQAFRFGPVTDYFCPKCAEQAKRWWEA